MRNEPSWLAGAVERLSQIFDQEPDARAFVLGGSLADPEVEPDAWSDLDAMIVLADHALDRYYSSAAWLSPFGRLIGAERHEHPWAKTLRVCLEGVKRFDLVFIGESALTDPSLWERNPFHPSYLVVWSRLADLEARIASLPPPPAYQDLPRQEIERRVDAFWLKAAVAMAKVARNDLLIGLHLALELWRETLVLQMNRRDREERTTIHPSGGWGNELVTRVSWNGDDGSGDGILNLIRLSCDIFDELAADLLPGYEPRGPLLFPSIQSARQICHTRTNSGS